MTQLNIGTAAGRLVDVSDTVDGYATISDADITGAVVPAGDKLVIETLYGGVNFVNSRIDGTVAVIIGDEDSQDNDDWVPDFQNCEIGENATLQIGTFYSQGGYLHPVTSEFKISDIVNDCDTFGYVATGAMVKKAVMAKLAEVMAKA